MASLHNTLVLALLFISLRATVTSAQTAVVAGASPEPAGDPTEEGLYLYSAGSEPTFQFALADDMTICPDDYPTGFNVLCVGASSKAIFYVNSNVVATEHRTPYYLAGNVADRVRPWTTYPRSAWIRCKLSNPKRNVRAHVFFQC